MANVYYRLPRRVEAVGCLTDRPGATSNAAGRRHVADHGHTPGWTSTVWNVRSMILRRGLHVTSAPYTEAGNPLIVVFGHDPDTLCHTGTMKRRAQTNTMPDEVTVTSGE